MEEVTDELNLVQLEMIIRGKNMFDKLVTFDEMIDVLMEWKDLFEKFKSMKTEIQIIENEFDYLILRADVSSESSQYKKLIDLGFQEKEELDE